MASVRVRAPAGRRRRQALSGRRCAPTALVVRAETCAEQQPAARDARLRSTCSPRGVPGDAPLSVRARVRIVADAHPNAHFALNAEDRSLTFLSREDSAFSLNRCSMVAAIDVVSCDVWSTAKFFFRSGARISAGIRVPGPCRSWTPFVAEP